MTESLAEQLKERLNGHPDKWTYADWLKALGELKKAYRGVSHAVNLCRGDYENQHERIKELEARVISLEAERDEARAVVAELAQMKERQDKMADFLNNMRGKETT